MLSFDEAMAQVFAAQGRMHLLRPFAAGEVAADCIDFVNESIASLQYAREARLASENPFVRAQQYLVDTYGFAVNGDFNIPDDAVDDLALSKLVKLFNEVVSHVETLLIVSNDPDDLLLAMYDFVK